MNRWNDLNNSSFYNDVDVVSASSVNYETRGQKVGQKHAYIYDICWFLGSPYSLKNKGA